MAAAIEDFDSKGAKQRANSDVNSNVKVNALLGTIAGN